MKLRPIEICHLDVKAINVDMSYQRPLDIQRVQAVMKAFHAGATKAISISRRIDGSLWCYDGQHTLEVYKLLGYLKVPATVVSGDQRKEAVWFLLMNGKGVKKATQRDKQKAGCVAGDELAIACSNLLTEFGIDLATGGTKKGKTSSLGEIKSLIRKDYARLHMAMGLIHRLWADEEKAWTQVVIRGVFLVCATEDGAQQMERALKKHKVTPARIIDTAVGMQSATGLPGGGVGYAKNAILQLAKLKD